ncbi:MAG: hypothetical protein ACOVSR_05955 [Bacteroidia bacterium]
MKFISLFFFIFYSIINSFGQTKKINGRVITEDFEIIPQVSIKCNDTTIISKVDMNGYFEIEIPIKNINLSFGFIGMEWTNIQLTENCDKIELIMFLDSTYDFMTFRKIDRIRRRNFKKLPNLYQIAHKKGIFTLTNQCFKQIFVPYNVKQKT